MRQYRYDHVHLRSPDPDATARFFATMFGAELSRDSGLQNARETVDVLARAPLGDRDQQPVGVLRVVEAERIPRVDALPTTAGEDAVEGYHLHVGGGYGSCQQIAREIFRDVKAEDAGAVIEKMLASYLAHRTDERESFQSFVQRHSIEQLRTFCEEATVNA